MNKQALVKLLTPVVEAANLEIDRLDIGSAGRRSIVRVYLDGDGPEGHGPSLDDIAGATRAISAALDESNVTGEAPYVLEVSSRGATRPLTEPKHFRRNTGRLVVLTLSEGGSLTGRIAATDAEGVQVELNGTTRDVPYEQITKAVVQLELKAMPDEDEELADDAADDEE